MVRSDVLECPQRFKYFTYNVGTKNVAKLMKGISCGTKKTEGKTWFLELSDKRNFSHAMFVASELWCLLLQVKVRKPTYTTAWRRVMNHQQSLGKTSWTSLVTTRLVLHIAVVVLLCNWHDCTSLQNQHSNCHEESPCRHRDYSSSKILLTSPAAIEAYKKTLQNTLIYKNAESYCRVRNALETMD